MVINSHTTTYAYPENVTRDGTNNGAQKYREKITGFQNGLSWKYSARIENVPKYSLAIFE